jgi:hypothetical protein
MERKHRRHPGAGPKRAGHAVEQQEEQDGIGRVQEQTGQVMAGGFQPVKLAIQHVRHPGQRMPIGGVGGGQGPLDALPVQAVLNVLVEVT